MKMSISACSHKVTLCYVGGQTWRTNLTPKGLLLRQFLTYLLQSQTMTYVAIGVPGQGAVPFAPASGCAQAEQAERHGCEVRVLLLHAVPPLDVLPEDWRLEDWLPIHSDPLLHTTPLATSAEATSSQSKKTTALPVFVEVT